MWSEHRFLSFDKTPIFYSRLRPASKAKATVMVVHGMGEHGGRYRLAAEYLAERGYQVLVPDLRGFGKSGGRRAFIRNFSDYHRDLEALHRFAISEEKEVPVFLLAHSLGGLIASSYLAFTQPLPLAGLILSSPCFGIALKVPGWKRSLAVLGAFIAPSLTLPAGLNPDYLTHDTEIVRHYKSDRLVYRRVSARLYYEMSRLMKQGGEIAARVDCPLLVLQAGRDLIVSKKQVLSFYEKLHCQPRELEVYPGFYHEVLNEIGRTAVLQRICEWIQKIVFLK